MSDKRSKPAKTPEAPAKNVEVVLKGVSSEVFEVTVTIDNQKANNSVVRTMPRALAFQTVK